MTEHSGYHKEFTAQDIERYYNGTMSYLEMHQLEKAAMEDPFLADALEGYSYTTTPAQDSGYLHSRLQSKMVTGDVVPIKKFDKNQFLKIAALFILLAGSGWAIYQFGFKTRNNDIASAKQTESSAPTPSLTTDSGTIESALPQSATNSQTNINTTITVNDDDETALSKPNSDTRKSNSGPVSRQKVTDQTGEILQEEKKTLNAPGEDAAISAKSGIRQINSDSGNIASAPQTARAEKESVNVFKGSKSNPQSETARASTKSGSLYHKPAISFEEAEPADGRLNYNAYVADHLQIPELEIHKNISGEIKLSFDVDAAGRAINIKVEKSLCKECDEEATRLLKQGPKWVKKKKDKKGKLSLKF